MDPVTALLFAVLSTWYATKRGIIGAGTKAREGHRERKAAHTPRPAPSGLHAGAAVAAAWTGGRLLARDFGTGWRQGWGEGRERARAWRDLRHDRREGRKADRLEAFVNPTPQPTDPGALWNIPDDNAEPIKIRLTDAERAQERKARCMWHTDDDQFCDQPAQYGHLFCAGHNDEIRADGEAPPMWHEIAPPNDHFVHPDAVTAPPTQEAPPVTTVTRLNPEDVRGLDDLLSVLEQLGKDQIAELEDSKARADRAADLASFVDNLVSWLANPLIKMQDADRAAVAALLDPFGAANKAALASVDAADLASTTAHEAAGFIARRHSGIQEAVDGAPADAPAAMDFYTNGHR